MRWPTEAELELLQDKEDVLAELHDEQSDPICECGAPSYSCCCLEMAEQIGYWPDGVLFERTYLNGLSEEVYSDGIDDVDYDIIYPYRYKEDNL
jgi:hypothetical protein